MYACSLGNESEETLENRATHFVREKIARWALKNFVSTLFSTTTD